MQPSTLRAAAIVRGALIGLGIGEGRRRLRPGRRRHQRQRHGSFLSGASAEQASVSPSQLRPSPIEFPMWRRTLIEGNSMGLNRPFRSNDALGAKSRQAMSNLKMGFACRHFERHKGVGTWPKPALRQSGSSRSPNSGPARELPACGLIVLKLRGRFAQFRIVGRSLIPMEGLGHRCGASR